MNVFIAGTRGIPNRYGGFEQFAEKLSAHLAGKGFCVTVFNPHNHFFTGEVYGKVNIVRKKNYEKTLGPLGTLLYDFSCLKHAYGKKNGIVLLCGYTSSFLIWFFFRKHANRTIVHMDGFEWKRSKWNFLIRWVIRKLEKFTARHFPHLVVDHPVLGKYYKETYSCQPFVIPYGAEISTSEVGEKEHFMLIARMEPENNIEMIIEGFIMAGVPEKLLIVGQLNTSLGKKLSRKYGNQGGIIFTGGIFDREKLSNLRTKTIIYFHGHSVGGTNPSLLEAMADGCLVAAHDNVFNRGVLGDDGFYFGTSEDVCDFIKRKNKLLKEKKRMTENNIEKIKRFYSWERVVNEYENFFQFILTTKGHKGMPQSCTKEIGR